MSTLTKRSTVYFDPLLHKALRMRSIETSRSISELINDTLRYELAEEACDLAIFDERRDEPTLDFEEFVKELKQDGTI